MWSMDYVPVKIHMDGVWTHSFYLVSVFGDKLFNVPFGLRLVSSVVSVSPVELEKLNSSYGQE